MEGKRKHVVDLTNDGEVTHTFADGKRVVIREADELCDGCEGPCEPGCGSFCLRCFNYTGHRKGEDSSADSSDDSSDDSSSSVSEEEGGNCCGICGSEYETRKDTADVCLECYESERNICHVCKEVKTPSEFLDEYGEYCDGVCKGCSPSVLDILDPVVKLLKK